MTVIRCHAHAPARKSPHQHNYPTTLLSLADERYGTVLNSCALLSCALCLMMLRGYHRDGVGMMSILAAALPFFSFALSPLLSLPLCHRLSTALTRALFSTAEEWHERHNSTQTRTTTSERSATAAVTTSHGKCTRSPRADNVCRVEWSCNVRACKQLHFLSCYVFRSLPFSRSHWLQDLGKLFEATHRPLTSTRPEPLHNPLSSPHRQACPPLAASHHPKHDFGSVRSIKIYSLPRHSQVY